METLSPFLPKPDIREIATQGTWGLPKEFDKCAKERNELDALMVVYQMGTLQKAQGIYEAFLRGLIKTPDDL